GGGYGYWEIQRSVTLLVYRRRLYLHNVCRRVGYLYVRNGCRCKRVGFRRFRCLYYSRYLISKRGCFCNNFVLILQKGVCWYAQPTALRHVEIKYFDILSCVTFR